MAEVEQLRGLGSGEHSVVFVQHVRESQLRRQSGSGVRALAALAARAVGRGNAKSVTESLGLYRQRLHPTGTPEGTDGWWEIGSVESAVGAATDMVDQLELAGWPILDRMLLPGGMLDQIRHGDLGQMKRSNFGVFFARAEALLLMGQGPSKALEASLHNALEHCMPGQEEHARMFEEWVREQAREAS